MLLGTVVWPRRVVHNLADASRYSIARASPQKRLKPVRENNIVHLQFISAIELGSTFRRRAADCFETASSSLLVPLRRCVHVFATDCTRGPLLAWPSSPAPFTPTSLTQIFHTKHRTANMAPAPPPEPSYRKDEKVFCFHHELLYEAKVLELKPMEGDDKKSGFQYRVHYKGWKNT